MSVLHSHLGNALCGLGFYELAARHHQLDADICSETDDGPGLCKAYANIGLSVSKKGLWIEAQANFEKQLTVAQARLAAPRFLTPPAPRDLAFLPSVASRGVSC